MRVLCTLLCHLNQQRPGRLRSALCTRRSDEPHALRHRFQWQCLRANLGECLKKLRCPIFTSQGYYDPGMASEWMTGGANKCCTNDGYDCYWYSSMSACQSAISSLTCYAGNGVNSSPPSNPCSYVNCGSGATCSFTNGFTTCTGSCTNGWFSAITGTCTGVLGLCVLTH